MDEQKTNAAAKEDSLNKTSKQSSVFATPGKSQLSLNGLLILGFCLIALIIHISSLRIAESIPHSIHGHFSGSLTSGDSFTSEFMDEWSASLFVGLSDQEFADIIASGELRGTYTTFHVERTVWLPWEDGEDEGLSSIIGNIPEPAPPQHVHYDIVLVEHRVFSRERLTEWLLRRIDNEHGRAVTQE